MERLAVVVLGILVVMVLPTVSADTDPVSSWITNRHGVHDFYTDLTRNDSAAWDSPFRPYDRLNVFVAGNVSWTVTDLSTNQTRNGSLVSGVSKEVFIVNSSRIWILVQVVGELNETFNFGIMATVQGPVQVFVDAPTPVVAIFEALAREWRMLMWTVIFLGILAFPIALSITRIKRGRIRER